MKRLLAMLLLVGMLLAVLPAQAAETVVQDGIKVTLITDKDSYEADEWINAQLDIQNTNSYPITNVRTSIAAPEGYLLLNGSYQEFAELSAGKSYVHKNSMVAAPEKPVVVPQTGDDSHIGLWMVLATLSLTVFCVMAVKSRKAGRMMSMLLCVVLISTLLPAPAPAKADIITKSIVVSKQVTVNGQTVTVKGIVTYDYEVEPATFKAGDFVCTYDETGKGIIILDYTGTVKDITVPVVINGSPVTGIAADAFDGHDGITLHVGAGSAAENYAQTMGIPYVVIGATPVPAVTTTPTVTPTVTPTATPIPTVTPEPTATPTPRPESPVKWFIYEIVDGECIITSYVRYWCGSTVVVPKTIEGYPVRKIADRAFEPDYSADDGDGEGWIYSLTLPETLWEIGAGAFVNQPLTELNLPARLGVIGNGAFSENRYYRSNLKEVTIPRSVTLIGTNPFRGRLNLETIKVDGNGLFEVVDGSLLGKLDNILIAYPNAYNKESYTIPDGVKIIGENAFWECELKSITFPDSVETIEKAAFYKSGLTNVELPKTLKVVENYTFYGCSNLKAVTIALDSVETIGKYAFEDCTNLEKVYIPDSVKDIAPTAFNECNKKKLVIYGLSGSYAETYANKYGITFQAIGEGEFPGAMPTPPFPGIQGPCNGTNHIASKYTYKAEHPHQLVAICICGAETPQPYYANSAVYNCCECVGHKWGEVIHGSTGDYIQNCNNCSKQIIVRPSQGQFMGDLFEEYRQTSLNDLFERTALNATNKMTEAGFTYINETINASSDISGSIVDHTLEMINGTETRDEAMTTEWEHLITQMLVSDFKAGNANNSDQSSILDGVYTLQPVNEGLKIVEDYNKLVDELNETENLNLNQIDIEKMADQFAGSINSIAKELQEQIFDLLDKAGGSLTDEQTELYNQLLNNQDLLKKVSSAISKSGKTLKKAAEVFKDAFKIMDTAAKTIEEYQKQNLYAQIALFYDEQYRKLECLDAAATAMGNKALSKAIDNVNARLIMQMNNSLIDEVYTFGEVAFTVVKSAIVDGVGEVMLEAAPPVKVLELIGKTADWLLNWDAAYKKGFELQTLGLMNNAIRSEVADIFYEDVDAAYYLSELYTILQIQGMNCSLEYLEAYDAARGLSVEEFGIDNMKDVQTTVESKITQLTEAQKNMNGVYYAYWVSTAQ